jgi:zinc protease
MYETKNMELYPYFNLNEQIIDGECFPNEIESLFQANYLFFTSPRFDNSILQNKIERKKGSSNMNFILQDSINSMTHNDTFKKQMQIPVSIEKFRDIYNFIYAKPADFTFYITGKISVDSIKTLTQQYIASITTKKSLKITAKNQINNTWWNVGKKSCAAKTKINVPYATVYVACIGNYDEKLKNTMPLYRDIITKLFMNQCNRILREQYNDVYSVHPVWTYKLDAEPFLLFSAYFKVEPQKSIILKDTTLKIMTDFFNGNFSNTDFETVKQEVVQQYKEQINSTNWFSTVYLPSCSNAQCFDPQEIEKITVENIKNVMQSIINQGNIIDIVLLPANTKSQ